MVSFLAGAIQVFCAKQNGNRSRQECDAHQYPGANPIRKSKAHGFYKSLKLAGVFHRRSIAALSLAAWNNTLILKQSKNEMDGQRK